MQVRVPSHKLTFDEAVQVWCRRFHGEFYSRIAADFDINQGRIADVVRERVHRGSIKIAASILKVSERDLRTAVSREADEGTPLFPIS